MMPMSNKKKFPFSELLERIQQLDALGGQLSKRSHMVHGFQEGKK